MLLLFCGVLLMGLSLSGPVRPASGPVDSGVSLPIIMYHHILKDPARQGEYVVSPQILEEDFAYLKRLGYESIVIQDLIDYIPVSYTHLKKDYTIVMVTHNMQQATRISDKTAFFLLGEVVEYDETENLFSMPHDKRTEDYITGRFG